MKNWILTAILICIVSVLFSCTHRHVYVSKGKVPPGHAKKYFGTKSAKPFAPGQRNKRVRQYRGR